MAIQNKQMNNKSVTEIKIRGYHLDAYQHVNNARYLELLEEARWRHYEDYPPAYFQERGWGFIIVNININFKGSAVLGDTLEIHSELVKIGNTSMTIHQDAFIKGSGRKSIEADITFVMMDLKTQKLLPVEGEMKGVLTRTMKV